MNPGWQNFNRNHMPVDTGIGNAKYDEQLEIYKTLDGVPVRKLYIAKIHTKIWGTNDKMLREAFSAYGEIQDVFFKDLTTSHKPSFAFLTYISPKSAAQDMISLGTKKLFITPADSWHQPHEYEDGTIVWDRRTLGYEPLAIAKPQEPENESEGTDDETIVQEGLISKINADCLEAIFSYLSLRERVVVGQVCRSWRYMNTSYWQSIKRLDFSQPPFDSIELNDKQLKYFLDHCPSITHLNIGVENDLTSESIVAIAKQCPNLVEIQIHNSEIFKNRCCALLGQYCRQLTSFRCDKCSTPNFDHEFLAFLKKAKKLEKLYLKTVSKTSLWMVQVNPPLKSLTLDHFYIKSEIFIEAIDRLKNTLTELTIIYPKDQYLYMSNVMEILKMCQKLTSVTINGILQTAPNESSILSPLGDLQYLKHLNLNRNLLVTDDTMIMIAEKCSRLERFSFCGLNNDYISDSGLKLICNLENLKHLSLAYHYLMTDDVLDKITKKLSKLEYLCIMSCSQITNSGCTKVLKNCKELAILDVSNCVGLDSSLLFSAIEDRNSGNKKQLTIIARDTNIFEDDNLQPEARKLVKVSRTSLEYSKISPHIPRFSDYEDDDDDYEDEDDIDYEGEDYDFDDDSSFIDEDYEDYVDWEDFERERQGNDDFRLLDENVLAGFYNIMLRGNRLDFGYDNIIYDSDSD